MLSIEIRHRVGQQESKSDPKQAAADADEQAKLQEMAEHGTVSNPCCLQCADNGPLLSNHPDQHDIQHQRADNQKKYWYGRGKNAQSIQFSLQKLVRRLLSK